MPTYPQANIPRFDILRPEVTVVEKTSRLRKDKVVTAFVKNYIFVDTAGEFLTSDKGCLYTCLAYSKAAAAMYVQIYDKSYVTDLSSDMGNLGDFVPDFTFELGSKGFAGVDFSSRLPWPLARGLIVAGSTSETTYAALDTADLKLSLMYEV